MKVVDRLGRALFDWWTPRRQVRTGVIVLLGSLVLVAYGPFADEPLLIYEMSAVALSLGALSIVVTAVLAVKEDPNTTEEDLEPDD